MPDSSIMLELCEILGITVNELLSGKEMDVESYEKKADENLIALKRKDEHNRIKNVIISKQKEDTKQYQQFLKLVKEKKIAVTVVKRGNRIQIEKGIYFDILWPENNLMEENPLNNNSIVTQFYYNQFSMLFTGDIEEPTEKLLLEKKINLKADILKVAHHRF